MKLVIIFGPPAVGKATVGQAFCDRYGFKLFHNHISLDAVTAVFEWGSPAFGRLVEDIRRDFIREAAEAGIDLVFTYVWDLDDPRDAEPIEEYRAIVESRGGRVYFVELSASQEERKRRNGDAGRRMLKSRSDEASTPEWIEELDRLHRMNTDAAHPFPLDAPHLRIDNTRLHPLAAAVLIGDAFGFGERA